MPGMTTVRTNHASQDKDRRLRRWVNVIVLVGILELPFLLWPWLSTFILPERFTNHQDQIAAALRRHGVSFNAVYLEQGWPDRINSQTYGANLSIHVSGSTPVSGRIECRVQKRKCWFQVARLNIARQELTDLVAATKPEPTLHDRLRDVLAMFGR